MKHLKKTLLPLVAAFGFMATGSASAATVADIVQSTSAANVFVFVEGGVATLSGTVQDIHLKTYLGEAVIESEEVNEVKNELVVNPFFDSGS